MARLKREVANNSYLSKELRLWHSVSVNKFDIQLGVARVNLAGGIYVNLEFLEFDREAMDELAIMRLK